MCEDPKTLEPIDILKALETEKPLLYKSLTKKKFRPLLVLLKKIINEPLLIAYLNRLRKRGSGAQASSSIDNLTEFLYQDLKLKITVHGEENLFAASTSPGPIIAANHTLGIIDGLVLVEVLTRRLEHTFILANRVVMHTKVFNDFFIPVGIFLKTRRDESKHIDAIYKSTSPIAIFPAGVVARKDKSGKVLETVWKKNFLLKALKFKRDIVPTYVQAENSALFYNIHRIRTFLRIKINLEMFLLVREALQAKNKPLAIHFGKPIPYQMLIRYISAHPRSDQNIALHDLSEKLKNYTGSRFLEPLNI